MSMQIASLDTPVALIDLTRMQHNIQRMQARMGTLGVRLRPHIKTSKCLPVIQAQIDAGASGVTVSTLKEAEHCFAAGIRDVFYAVAIAPGKTASGPGPAAQRLQLEPAHRQRLRRPRHRRVRTAT